MQALRRWPFRRIGVACAMLGVVLLTSACATDGSGGGMTTSPPPPPPPPPPPTTPDPTSDEYTRNYGLGAIHADAAFSKGATGQGIVVAVIDTGVDHTQVDLAGGVSSASTDIIPGRNAPDGTDDHGTFVAGVIGARFNGQGTIGVAYNATILGIRADSPGTCSTDPSDKAGCSFDDDELAVGIDYAIAHGAKVINLSLGGDTPSSSDFEAALARAVAAGIVVTASAGNDSKPNPEWPARYAIDPRYAGFVAAVGSTDKTNTLSSFSNKAGVAAAGFLVAPGEDVITGCTNHSCWDVSGTSFSAPVVAGALALMLQSFPTLSPHDALQILFNTADDLGDPGVDPVYGHGLLDLAKAFAPAGTLSVPTSASQSVPAMALAGSSMGSAFGDAFQATPVLTTVGFDSYRRMYKVNLAMGYPMRRQALFGSSDVGPQVQDAQLDIAPRPGVRLTLAAGAVHQDFAPPLLTGRFRDAEIGRTDLNLRLDAGRLSFQAWRGQGGMAPDGALAASSNAFAALSRPDHAVRAGMRVGRFTLSAESGGSSRESELGLAMLKPSSYAAASISAGGRTFDAALSAGRLIEPEGPLGSLLPTQTSFALPASTVFASAHADWAPVDRLILSADLGMGRTHVDGSYLALSEPAISTNWSLTAHTRCLDASGGCTSFLVQLAQPIRIEAGSFSTILPDVPTNYGDPLNFSRRSFSASPSGREIDLRFGVDRSLPTLGVVGLQVVTARDQGNVAGAPLSVGVLANWRTRF